MKQVSNFEITIILSLRYHCTSCWQKDPGMLVIKLEKFISTNDCLPYLNCSRLVRGNVCGGLSCIR